MVKVGDFDLVTGDLSSGSSGMFIAIVWDQEYKYILLMGYTVSFLDVAKTYIMVIYLVWIQYISFTDHSSRRQVSFRGMYGHELYMSPELLEHRRCTEKVDIYSLGVIYFEMNYMFTTGHEKNEVTY